MLQLPIDELQCKQQQPAGERDGAHQVHAPGSGLGRWGGSQKPLGSPKGEAREGSHSSQVVVG